MMKRLGKEPRFIKGVRVTDSETMEIVEMVLGGVINKEIVSLVNRHGGKAVGLTGKDGKLFTAQPLAKASAKDPAMGMVGQIKAVDPKVLEDLHKSGFIPVIAPIAFGEKGESYNINADLVAGAIASAIQAEKFLVLTDVKGIQDERKKLRSTLSRKEVGQFIKKGVISEGMLPKVEACLTALEGGVKKAHIIDGRLTHALLLEIFTDKGVGTEVVD
jgi:acetylglutamate kinase